jgi:hypothetical protein
MIAAVAAAEGLAFAGLWAVVGYADATHQKIRHAHLFYGLLAAAAGYALLLAHTGLGIAGWTSRYFFWGFYAAAAAHVALSAVVAMALWQLRIWPAGDAKLFVLLAAAYPLMRGSFNPDRLFLSLLINTFLPAAAFLFLRALWYVFDTRLRSTRPFLAALGWRRELSFLATGAADWVKKRRFSVPDVELRPLAGKAWGGLVALAPKALQWLTGMLFMSVASYYLKGALTSPLMLALLCMALFTLWGQVTRLLGRTAARGLLLAGTAALLAWKPLQWSVLLAIFANVSVFSFCMFLGMNAAVGVVTDGWAGAFRMLAPFAFMGVSLLIAQVVRFVSYGFWRAYHAALDAYAGIGAAAGDPNAPGFLTGIGPALKPLGQWEGFGPLAPYAGKAAQLAGLGLFFGVAFALVRFWDDEVRPSHRASLLAPNLLLAQSFVDRVAGEDAEFFAEHLSSLYADGLTSEQAQALKQWCADRGVETVPLAPTVSFASWIFLGSAVSLLLAGRHLLEVAL